MSFRLVTASASRPRHCWSPICLHKDQRQPSGIQERRGVARIVSWRRRCRNNDERLRRRLWRFREPKNEPVNPRPAPLEKIHKPPPPEKFFPPPRPKTKKKKNKKKTT